MTGATPVIMINETRARRLWPGQDPIGKSIVGDCVNEDRQVVPGLGFGRCGGTIHAAAAGGFRTGGSGAARPLIPSLPKGSMGPLTRLVDHAISPRRFIVLLLTGFATFALVLVSLGIYSVVSYSVTRRTQEIGIRMALGAQGARVQRQIVMETLGRATIGLAIGTVAAAVAVMLAVAGLAGYLPARRASRIDPLVALRVE